MGVIAAIDLEEQELTVQFAERQVSYDYADMDEITLAWSVSVHKAQGSEYPVVILPIFMQHYMMLSRHLTFAVKSRKACSQRIMDKAQHIRYSDGNWVLWVISNVGLVGEKFCDL